MAKKPLGLPLAPPGPQYDFFSLLQEMILKAGDPSLATLAGRVHCARQVLHRATRGPKMPSRDLTKRIADALFDDDETRNDARSRLLAAWTQGVADARQAASSPAALMTPGTVSIKSPRCLLMDKLHDLYSRAGSPSISDVALTTGLRRSTIHEWVTGRSLPREDGVLALLAYGLGASPSEVESLTALHKTARKMKKMHDVTKDYI
ncbi:helix-turn-helix domain-containing protein [Streptomyces adustus]|uniref:helix-turn-helix domain-containing protein n=1 Tax=Streptomyces adustus TaxID=1609272 RepID=UPI00371EF79D